MGFALETVREQCIELRQLKRGSGLDNYRIPVSLGVIMGRLQVGLVIDCASVAEWETWLAENHASAREVWLRFARKASAAVSVSRDEALKVALCYGWIDGQAASLDSDYWLQRFTPRSRRSRWSRINCETAERLIAAGRMKPAGFAVIEAAKLDGRWDAAYAPPSEMDAPDDLLARLASNPVARSAFDQLDARNRYAILYRIQEAKKPETRARRIERFVGMLERGERIH